MHQFTHGITSGIGAFPDDPKYRKLRYEGPRPVWSRTCASSYNKLHKQSVLFARASKISKIGLGGGGGGGPMLGIASQISRTFFVARILHSSFNRRCASGGLPSYSSWDVRH